VAVVLPGPALAAATGLRRVVPVAAGAGRWRRGPATGAGSCRAVPAAAGAGSCRAVPAAAGAGRCRVGPAAPAGPPSGARSRVGRPAPARAGDGTRATWPRSHGLHLPAEATASTRPWPASRCSASPSFPASSPPTA